MVRQCISCGARPGEALFPPRRPPRQPQLCLDCGSTAEAQRAERISARLESLAAFRASLSAKPGVPERQRQHAVAAGLIPRSRRSCRAAFRYRQAQPQLDLVDLLVSPP